MKNVYVLYEGDTWLSNSSLVPMGIFDNTDDLMGAARKLIAERHSDEDEVEAIGQASITRHEAGG